METLDISIPRRSTFKKPISIFEAIEKKMMESEEKKDLTHEDPEDETRISKKYRSEFLFPIQTVF